MPLINPIHLPPRRKRKAEYYCKQVVLQIYGAREDLRRLPYKVPIYPWSQMEAPSWNMGCISLGMLWSPSPPLCRVLYFLLAGEFS